MSTPQPPQHSVTPITNAVSAFDDKQQSLTIASPAEGLPAPTTEDVEVALSTIHRYASYLQNETLRLGGGLDQGDPIAEFERLNRRLLSFKGSVDSLKNTRKAQTTIDKYFGLSSTKNRSHNFVEEPIDSRQQRVWNSNCTSSSSPLEDIQNWIFRDNSGANYPE